MSLVYLAGAIDYAKEDERNGWRGITKSLLEQKQISSFDPSLAFDFHNTGDLSLVGALRTINNTAMMNSNYVIVYLPKSVSSVGTVSELLELAKFNNSSNKYYASSSVPKVYVVVPDVSDISQVSAYLLNAIDTTMKLRIGSGALKLAIKEIIDDHQIYLEKSKPEIDYVWQVSSPVFKTVPKPTEPTDS